MRAAFYLLASLALAVSLDASQRYFPLQVGNQWVLETTGINKQILNIQVLRSGVFNEITYYFVTGYGSRDMWLRVTPEGVVYSLDRATGRETKQAHTAVNAEPYSTGLSGCNQAARLGDPGVFPGLATPVLLQYDQLGCRGFIFKQEIYRWDTGLTQRTVAEGDGSTRTYHLVYARLDGRVVTADDGSIVVLSDFKLGAHGWLSGFSDYSLDDSDREMAADLRLLPVEIDDSRTGLYTQSLNSSTGSFMFFKRIVGEADGLKPNQSYELTFDFILDSNAPSGCSGDGGAPGENVFLKAGASVTEPVPIPGEENRLAMNIDKGSQQDGGADAGVVDTIANGKACINRQVAYVQLEKSYTHWQPVRTDDRGVLWLIIGTDSAYQGPTALYYESVIARLKPVQ